MIKKKQEKSRAVAGPKRPKVDPIWITREEWIRTRIGYGVSKVSIADHFRVPAHKITRVLKQLDKRREYLKHLEAKNRRKKCVVIPIGGVEEYL